MSRTLSEAEVVRALADQVCKRLTRRLIAMLQKLNNGLLSGEDFRPEEHLGRNLRAGSV
jgi:hypothetical protein